MDAPKQYKRILIWRAGLLGDTLVAVPALKRIRAAFPNAFLGLIWQKTEQANHVDSRSVLEGSELIDCFIEERQSSSKIERAINLFKLCWQLIFFHADFVIILEAPFWDVTRRKRFLRLLGYTTIVACDHKDLTDLRATIQSVNGALRTVPKIGDQLLRVLDAGNIPKTPPMDPTLPFSDLTRLRANERYTQLGISQKDLIAVGLWSNMPAKRWELDNYITVLRELHDREGLWPIFLGGAGDRAQAQYVCEKLGIGSNLAGSLSIQEGIAALAHCRLYLGNDTGVMHMAAAAGIPCVAIFSATNAPGLWEPLGEGHRVLRKAVPCEGCLLRECVQYDNKCLRLITPQEVLVAAREILDSTERTTKAQA